MFLRMKFLALFSLATAIRASLPPPPPSHPPVQQNCSAALAATGASVQFGANVAHAIHSITLKDLRVFNPNAKADNGIPTINLDLKSRDAILPNAPDRKGPDADKFMTPGMAVLDGILAHLGEEDEDLRGYTPLERIVHAFHMRETWAHALPFYRQLEKNPPSLDLCTCATDLEATQISKVLRYTALAIREPRLVYGGVPKQQQPGYEIRFVDWLARQQQQQPGYDLRFLDWLRHHQPNNEPVMPTQEMAKSDKQKPGYEIRFVDWLKKQTEETKPGYDLKFLNWQKKSEETNPGYDLKFLNWQKKSEETKPGYDLKFLDWLKKSAETKPGYDLKFLDWLKKSAETKPGYEIKFLNWLKNSEEKNSGNEQLTPDELLQTPEDGKVFGHGLETAQDWEIWKKAGILHENMPNAEAISKDIALFLYCKLN